MSDTLRVTAKKGRLVPDVHSSTGRSLRFIGWRECSRAADGNYFEEAEHVIPAAPGVQWASASGPPRPEQYKGESADLFPEGHEVRLTRIDAETKKPMVVSVPDDSFFRGMIRDGDLEKVVDEKKE